MDKALKNLLTEIFTKANIRKVNQTDTVNIFGATAVISKETSKMV